MKERNAPPPGTAEPRPHGHPPGKPRYVYPHQQTAGRPRPRRPVSKDDDVVDLGEVAMDAGKKLWRVINKKTRKSSSAASDSGRPDLGDGPSVGGLTVGVSGHNTEREILVRGFAVPEDIPDEDEEEEDNARDEEEVREHAHRTEDYVADMQALQIYESSDPVETFVVDPSAISPTGSKEAGSLSPEHIHSTTHSPPPLTPESEASDLLTSDTSSAVSGSTPSPDSRPAPLTTKSSLF
ncbi:hypothetical protein FRC07_010571 [Ceratobasidium sp. 392]|nr:hypothetical protein FRC07_010571 [Ceratobasidium sp. 392]